MISNVTPSSLQFEDTYNTLKYADRAKRIKIELRKNVVTVDAQAAQYAKALETLRQELETVKTRNTDLQKENNELKEKVRFMNYGKFIHFYLVFPLDSSLPVAKCNRRRRPKGERGYNRRFKATYR